MKERPLISLSGARRAFASKKMRRVGVVAAITIFASLVFSGYFPQAYDVLKKKVAKTEESVVVTTIHERSGHGSEKKSFVLAPKESQDITIPPGYWFRLHSDNPDVKAIDWRGREYRTDPKWIGDDILNAHFKIINEGNESAKVELILRPKEKKVNRSHKGSAEARTSSLMNVAGDWQGTWTFTEFLFGRRQNNFTMKIMQNGSQITGTTSEADVLFNNQPLVCEISGSIKNKRIRFLKKCGSRSYVRYEGSVTDDGRSAKGSFSVDQRPDYWDEEWSMTRISDANGHSDSDSPRIQVK